MLYQVPGTSQVVPKVQISNGVIDAELYLPDSEKGYYRAGRFDWSGVVSALEYDGHSYFGQWFKVYDPILHDAITGPVEAFDPLGYEEAKVGEHFVKVGVGVFERKDTTAYRFSTPYNFIDYGKWTVNEGKDQIEFTHDLEKGPFPYSYKKVVRLSDNKMIIEHTLTNTGKKLIDTDVFNHNFFVIDNDKIGPGYSVEFPFQIEADASTLNGFAVVEDNQIRFVKPLGENDRVRLRSVEGYGPTAKDYDIKIENSNTGAGVRITCDQPITNIIFWAADKTLCPEPYINVKVQPSNSFSWTITYDYYSLK